MNSAVVPLIDVERSIAYLLGIHANKMFHSTNLQPAEEESQRWLNAPFLRGGPQDVVLSNPYDEEKGEARSTSSTAGTTPTEPRTTCYVMNDCASLHFCQDHITMFLQALSENRLLVIYVCSLILLV